MCDSDRPRTAEEWRAWVKAQEEYLEATDPGKAVPWQFGALGIVIVLACVALLWAVS